MADSVIKYSDLIGEDDTFREIFENIDKLKKELIELTKIVQKGINITNPNDDKRIEELTAEVQKLTKEKKLLEAVEKSAIQTQKKMSDLTNEELIQREKQKIANREAVQIAKQNAIIKNKESGEIERLRARLSLTTIEWKKLSKEELENGKEGQRLIAQKRKLTDQLKRLERQTGDTRRNVGNYTDSLGRLGKVAVGVFLGRNLLSGITRIGAAFSRLIEQNKETNKEVAEIDKSIKNFGSSLSGVGLKILSFVSKPLTLFLDGVSAIFDLFADPKPLKEFSATSDQLKEETKKLNDELIKEKSTVESLFVNIQNTNKGSKERKVLIDQINKSYGQYLPKLLTEKSSLAEIEQAQKLVNLALERNFRLKIQNATQTDIITNKIKFQDKAFKEFQKTAADSNVVIGDEFAFAYGQLLDSFDKTDDVSRKARKSLTDYGFNVSNLANDIRQTNPELADLVEKIFQVSKAQGRSSTAYDVYVDNIKDAARENKGYNDALENTQNVIKSLTIDQQNQAGATNSSANATKKSTATVKDNTSAIEKNNAARLKAIEQLQEGLKKLEAGNVEDLEKRAIELEKIRYKNQLQRLSEAETKILQNLRDTELLYIEQYGESSDKVKEFRELRDQQLFTIQETTDLKEAEELKKHEQNLLDIRKSYADKRQKAEADAEKERLKKLEENFNKEVDLYIETNDEIDTEENEQLKKDSERIAKSLERSQKTKEFIKDLFQTASKVGDLIVKSFEKQSQAAQKLVEDQTDAVERQQERANQGLENTLKFEQEELARRESERIKAEKRQIVASKILTLFNLISAYAQNGDKNALQRGLVDFGILTTLETAIGEGFETGGFTGSDSSNKTVKGVVHANEYVVTAEDTKRFGLVGKSGDQFGEAMTDYFSEQTPVLKNNFGHQSDSFNEMKKTPVFNEFSQMNAELREIKKTLLNQQKNDFDIIRLTDHIIEISNKVTNKRMTTVQKVKKRL